MDSFFKIYTFIWITSCIFAVFLYIRDRNQYAFSHRNYWIFLLKPWRIATFIISASVLTFVAPYTGDYTWDYYDTLLMSMLTFITAPWAIAVFYKFRKGELPFKQAFVAFCCWMFSASWSYDIYIFFRDKQYPPTWWANIILSSILYVCAGLLWNLDWTREKGVFMSFEADNWPTVSKVRVFPKIFIATLPYVFIVALLVTLVIYKLRFSK